MLALPNDDKIILSNYNRTLGSNVVISCRKFAHHVTPSEVTCSTDGTTYSWYPTPVLDCEFALDTREKLLLGVFIGAGLLFLLCFICIICAAISGKRLRRRWFRYYYGSDYFDDQKNYPPRKLRHYEERMDGVDGPRREYRLYGSVNDIDRYDDRIRDRMYMHDKYADDHNYWQSRRYDDDDRSRNRMFIYGRKFADDRDYWRSRRSHDDDRNSDRAYMHDKYTNDRDYRQSQRYFDDDRNRDRMHMYDKEYTDDRDYRRSQQYDDDRNRDRMNDRYVDDRDYRRSQRYDDDRNRDRLYDKYVDDRDYRRSQRYDDDRNRDRLYDKYVDDRDYRRSQRYDDDRNRDRLYDKFVDDRGDRRSQRYNDDRNRDRMDDKYVDDRDYRQSQRYDGDDFLLNLPAYNNYPNERLIENHNKVSDYHGKPPIWYTREVIDYSDNIVFLMMPPRPRLIPNYRDEPPYSRDVPAHYRDEPYMHLPPRAPVPALDAPRLEPPAKVDEEPENAETVYKDIGHYSLEMSPSPDRVPRSRGSMDIPYARFAHVEEFYSKPVRSSVRLREIDDQGRQGRELPRVHDARMIPLGSESRRLLRSTKTDAGYSFRHREFDHRYRHSGDPIVDKNLDHVLYYGPGKTTEVFENPETDRPRLTATQIY